MIGVDSLLIIFIVMSLLGMLNLHYSQSKATIERYVQKTFDEEVSTSAHLETFLQNLVGKQTLLVSFALALVGCFYPLYLLVAF